MDIGEFIERFKILGFTEIVNRQTTFIDISCSTNLAGSDNKLFRIHFKNKQEFSLGNGKFLTIDCTDEHPLLLEYKEDIARVQLTSMVPDKALLLKNLENAAKRVFGHWRCLDSFTFRPADEFFDLSFGTLMETPITFASAAIEAAATSGVTLSVVHNIGPKDVQAKLLLLDNWYVIADDFRVEELDPRM